MIDKLQKLYELKKAEKLLNKHQIADTAIKKKIKDKAKEYELDKNK